LTVLNVAVLVSLLVVRTASETAAVEALRASAR
jgi:hypothetical protein